MESGLEDRNNLKAIGKTSTELSVSMESGLEDRNNFKPYIDKWMAVSLNGVRPRRPEQCILSLPKNPI